MHPLYHQAIYVSCAFSTIIYAFLFSLCIETLQLITKVGVFDVDDLMMNTVGGLIGWIIYCIIRFIYHKWKAKNKKKEED